MILDFGDILCVFCSLENLKSPQFKYKSAVNYSAQLSGELL